MNQREKHHEPVQNIAVPATPGGEDILSGAREQLDDLLAVGGAAIDAGLAKDSQGFLKSIPQTGGQ